MENTTLKNENVENLISGVNNLAKVVFGEEIEILPKEQTLELYEQADTIERELQVVELVQETVDRLLKVAYTKSFIDKEVEKETVILQAVYDTYFLAYVKPLTLAFEQIQKQNRKFEEQLQELSAKTLSEEIASVYNTEFSKLKKDKAIAKRVDEIFKGVDTYGKLIDKQLELNIQAEAKTFNNVPLVAEVKLIELNKELAEKYQEQLNNTKKR